MRERDLATNHPGLPRAVATTDLGSELGAGPPLPIPNCSEMAILDLTGVTCGPANPHMRHAVYSLGPPHPRGSSGLGQEQLQGTQR